MWLGREGIFMYWDLDVGFPFQRVLVYNYFQYVTGAIQCDFEIAVFLQ